LKQSTRRKIVLLGMMSRIPVPGVVWQTVHYLLGFQRLGYDVYYVETHARTPAMLMQRADDDSSAKAAAFIDRVMRRFDMKDRWAFLALHLDGRCYGLSREQLKRLYSSTSLIVNLHGGTKPLIELFAGRDRLIYLETDPVQLQIELHQNLQRTIDFLEPHSAFFTFAENYGNPDCELPISDRFPFQPTRQPVVLDLWRGRANGAGETFTTVGNWKQPYRDVTYLGEIYRWSKHHEFLKFIGLPGRTSQPFELALGSYDELDRRMLESNGWRLRHALDVCPEPDAYRDYITGSRAEFTVAKEQNVRLRTGWFSDRSATYLAAGRPVISQETGFNKLLPTGEGLFGFTTMDEIVAAVEDINGDYKRHSRCATSLAAEFFSHDVVLSQLLREVGEGARDRVAPKREAELFPPDMTLTPISRRPTRLARATAEAVLRRPIPPVAPVESEKHSSVQASIVVVTHDNLVFTRLSLESVLVNTTSPSYELIVVDNGSLDGTPDYLHNLAKHHRHVTAVLNGYNAGFVRACNQGLALARGKALVLLNNDTLVAPSWLALLTASLRDEAVGLVGPVTNRIANEAEVDAPYETWQQFLAFASERAETYRHQVFDIPRLTMFCLAMRRDVYHRVGPLDERFEIGLLEDDDYSVRVQAAGYRLVCAEGAFVHHFGESSFGKLAPTGEYARLFAANRKRFEAKWGKPWQPYGRRRKAEYESLTARIRKLAAERLPRDATVLVASRGDDELLELDCRQAWHFPQAEYGLYAGHHPADSAEAIRHLEEMRAQGAEFLLFPKTGMWWLDHYQGLREHLESRYKTLARLDDTCVIFDVRTKLHGDAQA
jgi:GT2 family glycosyltransferase